MLARSFKPVWILTIAIALIVSANSSAQQFALPVTIADALQPEYSRRDLATFAQILELDTQQRTVVESLFADYEAAFREGADEVREQLSQLVPLAAIDDEVRDATEQRLRARMAELMDQVQRMQQDPPTGDQAIAVQREIQQRAEELRKEAAVMNGERVPPEQLQSALGESAKILERWQRQRRDLASQFEAGSRTILTESQSSHWPALERQMRRDKYLSRGRLSGESVNILLIVRDLDLTEVSRLAITPVLAEYELQLDSALIARQRQLELANVEVFAIRQSGDQAKAKTLAADVIRSRTKVRKANDEAAASLVATLPSTEGKAFLVEFRQRGYGRVFRTSTTQRLFNAAMENPELDASTIAALTALQQAYQAEAGPVNERLLAAIRDAEPVELDRRMVRQLVGGEEDLEPEVERLEKCQDELILLEKRYEAQIESILGPESWGKLPNRPSDRGPESEPGSN